MSNKVFSPDCKTTKELKITEGAPISDLVKTITVNVSEQAVKKGDAFAQEITDCFLSEIFATQTSVFPTHFPSLKSGVK